MGPRKWCKKIRNKTENKRQKQEKQNENEPRRRSSWNLPHVESAEVGACGALETFGLLPPSRLSSATQIGAGHCTSIVQTCPNRGKQWDIENTWKYQTNSCVVYFPLVLFSWNRSRVHQSSLSAYLCLSRVVLSALSPWHLGVPLVQSLSMTLNGKRHDKHAQLSVATATTQRVTTCYNFATQRVTLKVWHIVVPSCPVMVWGAKLRGSGPGSIASRPAVHAHHLTRDGNRHISVSSCFVINYQSLPNKHK